MMRILGVGLSKTGTTSLHRAFGMLGLRSLHFDDKRLNDVIDGSNAHPDFRRYDDVDAVLDIPAACFFEELTAAYPQCKCILTVRDELGWWKSMATHTDRRPVASPEDNRFKWHLRNFVYGSSAPIEFLYRKRYRQHNDRVIQTVPADRLLIMDITAGDGWEKLCPFLDMDPPSLDFPHQNRADGDTAAQRAQAIDEILGMVPAGSTFALIDVHWLEDPSFPDRQVVRFHERDGQDWGPPADDDAAIEQCRRLCHSGVSHIVFTWPTFWWLDYYSVFQHYLRTQHSFVTQNDRIVVVELSRTKESVTP